MFEKDSYIVYGSSGLCRVCDVGPSPLDPTDQRIYYALHPVSAKPSSMIFIPVENETVVKRQPMKIEQAKALLASISRIPALSVSKEKQRRDVYRAALKSANPIHLVALIRAVAERRVETARIGRRLTDADTECESKAKDNLFYEIAHVLSISRDDVAALVESALEK